MTAFADKIAALHQERDIALADMAQLGTRILTPSRDLPECLTAQTRSLKALELLGHIQKPALDMAMVGSLREKATQYDDLLQAAAVLNVPLHLVRLEGKWQSKLTQSIIVFDAKERAFIFQPRFGRRPLLIDPETLERRVLTAKEAVNLQAYGLILITRLEPDLTEKQQGRALFKIALQGNGATLITVLLLGLSVALLGLLSPIITGKLVGDAIPKNAINYLIQLPLLLLCSILVIAGFNLIKQLALTRLITQSTQQLQAAMLEKVMQLPLRELQQFNAGQLANRILSFENIAQLLTGTQINTFLTGLFGLTSLGVMFYYLPMLAFWALLCALVYASLMAIFSYLRMRFLEMQQLHVGKANGYALQLMTGIAKLKSTFTEALGLRRWFQVLTPSLQANYSINKTTKWESLFSQTVQLLSLIVVYGAVALTAKGQLMSVANFVTFNSAFLQFFAAISGLNSVLSNILQARALYKLSKPLLLAESENAGSKDRGRQRLEIQGDLCLTDICFRYPGQERLVLDHVNLQIKAGEFVAVVGESGGGKSTLLKLLLNFEQPISGSIMWDDVLIEKLDKNHLRRQLGVVLQDAKIIGGSLYDNLAGFQSHLSEEAIYNIAAKVGLEQDLAGYPMGLHTVLPDGGGNISGGQRQRILIARALAAEPKVLILDEATSAMDNHSQQVVMEAIQQLEITRIVIAHRLSTIRHADRIIVMSEGKVAESGTFEELMSQEGIFYQLAKRQTV